MLLAEAVSCYEYQALLPYHLLDNSFDHFSDLILLIITIELPFLSFPSHKLIDYSCLRNLQIALINIVDILAISEIFFEKIHDFTC